jgi:hypothetical protein
LTCRLLSTASSLPTGEIRPQAVLKTFILFIIEYGCAVKEIRVREKPCGCWNADGVRGRKLELEDFLSEHGVDIFVLNETYLESDRALSFTNYVCH